MWPSRRERKIIALLSGVQVSAAFTYSFRVRCLGEERRAPFASMSAIFTVVCLDHCWNARRFPSAVTLASPTQNPDHFVIFRGFSMGFPLRGSIRNSQKLQ